MVVDSILPVEEEIRRFKAALTTDTGRHELTGGASSREELVRALVRAIETHDTAVVRSLLLDAPEFINIYYPNSVYARPPYKQSPAFLWFHIQQNSEKGIGRALQRFGGNKAGYRSHACREQPDRAGNSRLWQQCKVAWELEPATLHLFGTIIERNRRFKFVSYANDL